MVENSTSNSIVTIERQELKMLLVKVQILHSKMGTEKEK